MSVRRYRRVCKASDDQHSAGERQTNQVDVNERQTTQTDERETKQADVNGVRRSTQCRFSANHNFRW